MWVITTDGVYSVTAYDPRRGGERPDAEELLIVRARVRADLERIAEHVGGEILDTPRADYPFRTVATRNAWWGYLEAATEAIDYTNFKSRVQTVRGRQRHDVLMRVWTDLRRLEG